MVRAAELEITPTGTFFREVVLGGSAALTQVFTVAGSGRLGTALGIAAQSDLVAPAGLALLGDGSLLVSDSFNNTIRRVVP